MKSYLRQFSRLSLIAVLLLLSSISHTSYAQTLKVKGIVNLATGEGYSPYVDVNLPQGGWSTNLVKQSFSQLNFATNIQILPWNRALKWTQENQFLATYPFVYSKQRAELFLFSVPINTVPVHMFVASQSGFKQPADLIGKRLCFPFSYSLDSVEQGIVDKYKMTINRATDGIGCIKHVQKGWSDAGLTNGYLNAKKFPKDKYTHNEIVIFAEQLELVPLYLMVGKDHPNAQQWIDNFNRAFLSLTTSGVKHTIDETYMQLLQGQ